jgi:hypothetical protein
MKSNRRIMYLRDSKNQPVGCIAISISKDRRSVQYQLSVLNPADRFERSLARHITLGRLVEKPIRLQLSKDASNHVVSELVMTDISELTDTPSRARKAAKLWIDLNRE